MKPHRHLFASPPALLCALGLCVAATASRGALPEAIVSTNSLPPAAGQYELWPPPARAIWDFDFPFDGTNMGCRIELERLKAGSFTNIVRSISGNDQILEFDATMETKVPVFLIGEWDEGQLALYDQLGHFRVRAAERAVRSNGWFALTVESISWSLLGYDDEGNPGGGFFVRLQNTPASTGWLTVTNLPDGSSVMQSELLLHLEGMWTEVTTNYHPTVSGPLRLALRGTSRTLEILFTGWATNTAGPYLALINSSLGTNYQYGIEYTTNGAAWQDYSQTDIWGTKITWFDNLENWGTQTVSAPMKWFRLKARHR